MTTFSDLLYSWDKQFRDKQSNCVRSSGHEFLSDRYMEIRAKQDCFSKGVYPRGKAWAKLHIINSVSRQKARMKRAENGITSRNS